MKPKKKEAAVGVVVEATGEAVGVDICKHP